jgi:hypothetical protein
MPVYKHRNKRIVQTGTHSRIGKVPRPWPHPCDKFDLEIDESVGGPGPLKEKTEATVTGTLRYLDGSSLLLLEAWYSNADGTIFPLPKPTTAPSTLPAYTWKVNDAGVTFKWPDHGDYTFTIQGIYRSVSAANHNSITVITITAPFTTVI